MPRRNLRIWVDETGVVDVVDPGMDILPLIRSIRPSYKIRRSPLPGFTTPRFLRARTARCGLPKAMLVETGLDQLWERHDSVMRRLKAAQGDLCGHSPEEASMLELKAEIARRLLYSCILCGHRCGVDRMGGEKGVCGLGQEALVAEHFVHIAEEPPINPSLVVSLFGCGLRCAFCQQWDLLDQRQAQGDALEAELWDRLDPSGARSLSFLGGNPDESLWKILAFLITAPSSWRLPIVWNENAFATGETLRLLDGVVDVYVPDLKFGNERCARELSISSYYPKTAEKALAAMAAQEVPVIVRILVLPGHVECCHRSVLDFLSTLNQDYLFVSI